MVQTDPMSEVEALRDRLIAELEAAIAAAIEAAARDRHRPIAEVGPTDATAVLASVARVAHYDREYDAGTRTVAKLTLPERWPLPTAERMARWLLKYPEKLPLASAVAKAAMLTPADAHAEHEHNAHRAAERWLRDFRKPYALGVRPYFVAHAFMRPPAVRQLRQVRVVKAGGRGYSANS